MKAQTIKGLLVAGAMLASVAAWGENVESTATRNANLDTREMPLVVSEPEGVFALAWNNAADWRKNGDGSCAAATVTATPMFALPGPGEGWIPSGAPTTLVNAQTGEGVEPFAAQDRTGYRFVFTVGESSVTSYVAVASQGLDDRATVTIDGSAAPVAGTPLTATATAIEGKTVGTLSYAWYRYDFDQAWCEGEVVSTAAAYTPTAADYEKFLRVLVTDADGYVAFGPAIWFSKLPVIYIETEGHQPAPANKADIGATMAMQGNAKFTNTKQLYSGALKLHIRGNTTSTADKKPYKIKLGSKCDLLGMGKQKHWTLLSNPYDISLMRNKVIYDLSEQLGLTAMASEWADVILNGAFVGNYQVCEHIRVGETRVDIYDWEDKADKVAEKIADAKRDATKPAPTEDVPDPEPTMTEEEYEALLSDLETYLEQNLQWITTGSFVYKNETYVLIDYGEDVTKYDTTGGYLFELDPVADEVSMFNSGTADGKLNMLIKANRPEYLKTNPEMYGYVQDVWSNYWAAIVSPDGYSNGRHFSELCDIDSMTGYWLAQVIPAQGDYQLSRYAYIPQQKGITWGPAWDFDYSAGGRSINWVVTEGSGVTGGRGGVLTGWSLGTTCRAATEFYCHWNNDPRFVQLLVEKFQQVTPYLDNLLKDGGAFDEMYDYLLESGVANARRWAGRTGGSYAVTAGTRFDDYPDVAGPNGYGDAHWFKYVLKSRVEWIKSQFTSVRAGVTSLGAAKTGANPYTDSVDQFTLDIDGESLDMPNSKEGATPDKIVPADNLVAAVGVATEGAKRLAVYVNGLLNGTYTIVMGNAGFEVTTDELKVGERNMLSFAALDNDGNRLTTSYALLTVAEPAKFPQSVVDLEDATIEVETMGYTGAPLTPAVTLKTADGTTLVAGVDYTVTYANNVHYGLATVTVTGTGNATGEGEFGENGNWIGTRTFTFEIVENVVFSSQTKTTDLDTRDQAYRIGNVSEVLKFAYNNVPWTKGGDTGAAAAVVTVTQMSGDPAADPTTWTETSGIDTLDTVPGEHTAWWVPEEKALYRAEMTDAAGAKTRAYFDLSACEGIGVSIRRATVTLSAEDLTYTGEQLVPTMVVTFGDILLHSGVDYMAEITDNVNAGLATITIRGIGAYSGVTEKTFRIQPQPATLGAVALDTREPQVYVVSNASEILDFAYNNKAAWPRGGDPSAAAASVVMTTMNGDPAADPATWTETSGLDTLETPSAEGTTVWYPEGKALFKAELTDADGVKTRAYYNLLDCEGLGISLKPAVIELSVGEFVYTGEEQRPDVTVTYGDTTLVEGQDYIVTIVSGGTDAGLAILRIQGIGAYAGNREATYKIQPAPATLTADLDTRELAVRKPASVDEILALAWNNTSAWQKGGDTAGTAVVLALTPMAGEDPSDPTTWTDDGAARTLVSAAGEGANVWTRPAAKLYKATLVGGATLGETAYFDLSDLELPPDPVERLAEIFGDKATVEMAADGTVEVTLTDDLEEPLELPDDLGKVAIDLVGHDLAGTDGDAESPDGTAAITIAQGEGVDGATELALVGGDVTGGAGYSAAGSGTAGNGGAAILVLEGATATVSVGEGVTVTGGKGGDSDVGMPGVGGLGVDPETAIAEGSAGTVKSGENGKDTAEAPTVNIVKALQRYPWNGKIDVDYTVRGAASRYDLVLTLAADGQSWTASAANLSGDVELTDGMTEANVKRVTWDAAADCGTAVVDKNATLTLTVKRVR